MASKHSFRIALAVVLGSIAIIVGIGAFFVHRAFAYADAPHAGSGHEIEVDVTSGMSFPAVAKLLGERAVITKPSWFRLFAMWEGKTTDVKTGKYLLKDNLTPRQVLAALVEGVKEVTVKVTLPEGKNMLEYFEIIDKAKVASAVELEALARDKTFLAKFAITGDTVDGELFPDTYQFRVGEKPATVLERLIDKHREVWNDVMNKHAKAAAALKKSMSWSDRDVLTMASIVEKEAVEPTERPRIAQVFMNRLTSPTFKPRRLETDPTIRYGCLVPTVKSAACKEWIDGCVKQGKQAGCDRLHAAQLHDEDNAYNTYTHDGLPPGPISNPGRASIEATLEPDGSDYFFFVATSKGSRSHAFAKTVAEHEKNVQRYVSGDSSGAP